MDNKYMQDLIVDFGSHLSEAIKIGGETNFSSSDRTISNVLVCGLGGSGIGGTNVQKILESEIDIPILTNKGYHLPNYVNERTLVICSSYSGNTEETIAMYHQANEKGAEICVISSGGQFIEIAKSNNLNYIQIPGGLPPRAAFGLAFPQIFFVL